MDYEKKYNEALKWMREMYPCLTDSLREDAEHYFPELRESEDERIIEEIKFAVMQMPTERQDTKNRCLAYLEKQKEKKFDFELIQRSWYMEGYNDRDFFMEPKWILNAGEGGPKYEPNPRYGKSLILGPEPCCCGANVESEYDKGWRDGHKAGLKDAEIQKPAEWSEEDERYINGLIGLIEDMKVGISPKLRGVTSDRCIAFLKSLRPSWKPSEEQMNSVDMYKND